MVNKKDFFVLGILKTFNIVNNYYILQIYGEEIVTGR